QGLALYAAGEFTTVDGVTVNHVSRWNGQSWSPLGGGTNGKILALAVFDDGTQRGPSLFAAGSFTAADGVPGTKFLARWNGHAWSDVGGGLASSSMFGQAGQLI